MANNQFFYDVVDGEFGRQTPYFNADFIDESNVLDALDKTKATFSANKTAAEYLWNYFKGDQPAHYRTKIVRSDINNKVVENHAFEIVMFKNGQTYGEPITYVSVSKDDTKASFVDVLNDYCRIVSKEASDLSCGEWQSAAGVGFKGIFYKDDPNAVAPFGIVIPTPLNTWIVYSSNTQEPIVAFQEFDTDDGTMYKAWTPSMEFTCTTDTITEKNPHAYGDIPIVDYPNNQNCLSDIEVVIDLLDAINSVQSNRVDAIDQFVQAFLKFINCEIDGDTLDEMKSRGAIAVHSRPGDAGNAEVDTLSLEMNQENGQTAKDDMWQSTMSILAIPNKEGNTGGDTQGAVELRNGWDFSKTRARIKDAFVKKSERRFARLITTRLKQVFGETQFPITELDYDVHIVHSPTDNLYTKTQALTQLLAAGIDPLVAIKTCGLWSDCEKVFVLSKPYLDNKYKTVDEAIDATIEERGLTDQVAQAEKILAGGSGSTEEVTTDETA